MRGRRQAIGSCPPGVPTAGPCALGCCCVPLLRHVSMLFLMSAANKIIVAIAGDPVEDIERSHGHYGNMIAAAIGPAWAGDYVFVDLRDDSLPTDGAALVISGSSAHVHSREPWMVRSEASLRELAAAGLPMFGICFGHQLMAQALGGEVTRHPGGREISTVEVATAPSAQQPADPLLAGIADRFVANACHSDTVGKLPSGATVLGGNEHEVHQILRFGERCYGVQFHPEFDGEVMRAYVSARADAMREEGLDPAEALARARDTDEARELMRSFVRTFVTR